MKKICMTCKHATVYNENLLLCANEVDFSSLIVVETDYRCDHYKKLSNKKIVKRIASTEEIESYKYNEFEGYICEIEFDKEEYFSVSIPISRKNAKRTGDYYEKHDAEFLVKKLNRMIEE